MYRKFKNSATLKLTNIGRWNFIFVTYQTQQVYKISLKSKVVMSPAMLSWQCMKQGMSAAISFINWKPPDEEPHSQERRSDVKVQKFCNLKVICNAYMHYVYVNKIYGTPQSNKWIILGKLPWCHKFRFLKKLY
jgi:hypothetical protein